MKLLFRPQLVLCSWGIFCLGPEKVTLLSDEHCTYLRMVVGWHVGPPLGSFEAAHA